MIVLDTDHISRLQHPESQESQFLSQRLAASPDRDIVTTVATVEEPMRGWLRVIARYNDLQQQVAYYGERNHQGLANRIRCPVKKWGVPSVKSNVGSAWAACCVTTIAKRLDSPYRCLVWSMLPGVRSCAGPDNAPRMLLDLQCKDAVA